MNKLIEMWNKLPTGGKVALGAGVVGVAVYVWKSGGTPAPTTLSTPADQTSGSGNDSGNGGGDSGTGSGDSSSGSGTGGSNSGGSSGGGSGAGNGGTGGTVKPTPTPTKSPTVFPQPQPAHSTPTVQTHPIQHTTPIVGPTSYGSGAITPVVAYSEVLANQILHNPDFQDRKKTVTAKPSPPPEPYTPQVQQVNYNRISAVQTMHNPDFQKPKPKPAPKPVYIPFLTPNRNSGNHNAKGRNSAI